MSSDYEHRTGVVAPIQSEDSPVSAIETDPDDERLEEGIALCLSGGGYRAMLFHVGALWRLNEAGCLDRLDRVSSVSGGSITAGVLACYWNDLDFSAGAPKSGRVAGNFTGAVVDRIRALAQRTIDRASIIGGILMPGSIGDKVADAYDDYLFDGRTLQDLPNEPRFVINATNVQSGALWRFMKPYMRDYRVGEVKNPDIRLAVAVAASSAFPPVLSPVELELDERQFTPNTGKDLQEVPYTTTVVLSDGGVYDNLGLETAWKRYRTILVSDAGGKMAPQPEPKHDWVRHAARILDVIDNQVRSLRKRQLIGAYVRCARRGAYWGIRTDIANYELPTAIPCCHAKTMALAALPTRLKRVDGVVQERLINWGYAVADAAMRKHVDPNIAQPLGFPYPAAGVG